MIYMYIYPAEQSLSVNTHITFHLFYEFPQGSLVWFDGNVGYPLPGRIVSVMGSNVNVQLEDSRQVI